MRLFVFAMFMVVATDASAIADSVPSYVVEKCGIPAEANLGDHTPEKFAHLPGVYTGRWENVLDSTLVVQDVDQTGNVTAYYAWGTYAPWNIRNSGCTPRTGTVSDDTITLPGGRKITYRLRSEGEFRGTFDYGRGVNRGTFERIAEHPWRGNAGVTQQAAVLEPTDAVPTFVTENCKIGSATVLGSKTAEKFSHLPGVYVGKWQGVLESALIVTDVDEDGDASAFYAWNTYSGWNINNPGCSEMSGEVDGEELEFENRSVTIKYTPRSQTELDGKYRRGSSGSTPGRFTKLSSHPWSGR